MELPQSMIDLLSEFFPVSIDLPKEMVAHTDTQPKEKDAPKPLFIESCVFKDLSFLLSANERVMLGLIKPF